MKVIKIKACYECFYYKDDPLCGYMGRKISNDNTFPEWCPLESADCKLSKKEDEDHPNYPLEWRYGDDGKPKCTAFEND